MQFIIEGSSSRDLFLTTTEASKIFARTCILEKALGGCAYCATNPQTIQIHTKATYVADYFVVINACRHITKFINEPA